MELIKKAQINGATAFIGRNKDGFCLLICPDGVCGYKSAEAIAEDLWSWSVAPPSVRLAGKQWPESVEEWESLNSISQQPTQLPSANTSNPTSNTKIQSLDQPALYYFPKDFPSNH